MAFLSNRSVRSGVFVVLALGMLSPVAFGQAVLDQEKAPVSKTKKAKTKKAKTKKAKTKKTKTKKLKKEGSRYLRVQRDDDDDPISLQTSIVTFRGETETGKPNDVVVDLIGAVHIGEKSYYRQLNREFTKYDALLYELVAPEHANVPVGGKSQHPVGQMQTQMKTMLQLAYQLEEVNYRKRNFVHADMSPTEFDRVMGERNESWMKMMFKMTGAALAMQSGKSSDADLLFALFAPASERALRLKRAMSTQFGDLEGIMGVLEGEDGSTIIGMRNKKALDVLERELGNGKKRIGIFYGAGHFPDMEERMLKRFGMKPDKDSIRWITAWDMKD